MDQTNPPYVSGFLEDVFISYARADEGSEKWVSSFTRLLKEKLEYELTSKVRVWIDEQLDAGDVLDAALKRRVQNSALMISIVSHWYFERPWCRREVEHFLSGVEANGGLMIGTGSRLIPIIKRATVSWPPQLERLNPLTVSFCDGENAFPPVVEGGSDFFNATQRLARDLAARLKAMKEQVERHAETQAVLVLAPMSGMRRREYEHLRNWLEGKQCIVRPMEELPRAHAEISTALASELNRTRLAIHLLGPVYDMVPAQSREPRLSVEALAFETVRNSGKRQLVWAGAEPRMDAIQETFLERVKSLRDQQQFSVGAITLKGSLIPPAGWLQADFMISP